ncbi:hypothetical protein HXX02_11175 [Microbulbifer elongatus]|uniref:DUF6795 domain-containing protein n=1 Tax=Microbulbifer elongatus TaxID=86173 RepID=A0ABT1P4R4_9GAMM|nr:hypothetical protein [Microbulbifer elongatus]
MHILWGFRRYIAEGSSTRWRQSNPNYRFSEKKKDETTTDENGYFEFPARFERHAVNILPQEFVAGQEITVTVDDQEVEIWSGIKRNRDENAEARGAPLSLLCELENETKLIHVNNQPFFTRCIWNVEPDVIDNGF